MFNKNFFVILVFLLFILQISFVNAQNDNQTEIINESSEPIGYSEINNISTTKFENNIEHHDDKMEFYQGVIPIHIDSPSDGDLKVLVDNMEYGVWNFTKDKTIYILTYNPESFHDNSKINIDVGLHNISLIFNFKKFISKDANIFIDNNSTLNFKFNKNYISHINTYTYNSTWNILKKDKTIHILNFTYYNLCELGKYIIHMDNYDLWFDDNIYDKTFYDGKFYGITIINSNNELIHKQAYDYLIQEYDYLMDEELEPLYTIYEVGVYNLTVISFMDGTWDSVLFKANKYQPKFNITHIINGNSININITIPELKNYEAATIISLDNIPQYYSTIDTKIHVIMTRMWEEEYIEQASFENLSSGVHTLNIYCQENKLSEEFNYTMSFEIEGDCDFDDENKSTINQNIIYQPTSNQNRSSDKNFSFFKGNTTSDNIASQVGVIKDHTTKNFYSNEKNWNFEENIINSIIGDDKTTQSSSSSPTKKSYEVMKKSSSKLINEITPLQLIVIIIILLLIGYFKFGEKKED